jgi:hypothetical protein
LSRGKRSVTQGSVRRQEEALTAMQEMPCTLLPVPARSGTTSVADFFSRPVGDPED